LHYTSGYITDESFSASQTLKTTTNDTIHIETHCCLLRKDIIL